MDYQWDKNKERINRHKHGIALPDAIAVFADDNAFTVEDDYPDEERFVTVGTDAFGRILVVVYTWRGENIRVSSRPAKPQQENADNTSKNDENRV